MSDRSITDEDLCAGCGHCSLLQPKQPYTPGGVMWHAQALCAAGWPFTRICVQANAVSDCPRFTKDTRQ